MRRAALRTVAREIRDGHRSPAEELERSLARMASVEPAVGAFVSVDEERVRAEAAALTDEAARGRFRGPLHGVPIAVKDLIDVRGHPTRAGSRVTDGQPAAADAPSVRRLRDAGALVLGKTATHEFAHGVTTPPTRNPWDTSRIPGGSSGGSAAAVAAGECTGALGSDTGGSIRVPAALCGVSGLRPLPSDIPAAGCLPFSPKLDTCGPIAGDAEDLALLFRVLSATRCHVAEEISGLRVGVVPTASLGDVDADVVLAVDAAVRELAAAGATTTPVAVPPFTAWSDPRTVYVLHDFLAVHRAAGWYPDRADRYGEEVASYLALAGTITVEDRERATRELYRLEGLLRAGMEGVDVVVLPTTAIPAPTVAECAFTPEGGSRSPVVATLMRLCGPFSWCGLAAVTVPCGVTPVGLPIGLQIVGRDVPTVLGVAARYQARTDHHLAVPAVDDAGVPG